MMCERCNMAIPRGFAYYVVTKMTPQGLLSEDMCYHVQCIPTDRLLPRHVGVRVTVTCEVAP